MIYTIHIIIEYIYWSFTFTLIKVFFRDKYSLSIADTSLLACKLVYYSIYVAGPVSSWTLVLIAIDRLLTLAWPARLAFLSQISFQILAIAVIYIFNMTYYSYILLDAQLANNTSFMSKSNMTVKSQGPYCEIPNEKLLFWLDLLNSSLLPFISMMIISALTIVFILR